MDFKTALAGILANMEGALVELALAPVLPDEAPRGSSYIIEEPGKTVVTLSGESITVRMVASVDRIALFTTDSNASEAQDGDFNQISLLLFDPETSDDRDIKSAAAEFSETLTDKYGKSKKAISAGKKTQQTVSKSAIKNGDAYYDANSFVNRLVGAYPELKELYRSNYETHGEFMPEEFFANGGTKAIIDTIRVKDPSRLKRLFNILNEVYDNGVNDVQSLIAVSILGEMKNDQQLLANCVDYMEPDLCSTVIQINKYLASSGSKSARMRLEHPPKYKPKKDRNGGLMGKLMNMGATEPGSDIGNR